jgi:hypothetical protein
MDDPRRNIGTPINFLFNEILGHKLFIQQSLCPDLCYRFFPIFLLVDGVDEVLSIKQSEMEDAHNVGSNESAPFIEGVWNRNKELPILLNVESILTEDDWQEITNL